MEGGQQQIQNQQQTWATAQGQGGMSVQHDDNDQGVDEELVKQLEGMSEDEILNVFAEGLLMEKGLGEMEPEIKDELREDLVQRLTAQINQAVINALPEEKMRELNTLLESGEASGEKINQIVASAGIDTDTIVSEAMQTFRGVYLGEGR